MKVCPAVGRLIFSVLLKGWVAGNFGGATNWQIWLVAESWRVPDTCLVGNF